MKDEQKYRMREYSVTVGLTAPLDVMQVSEMREYNVEIGLTIRPSIVLFSYRVMVLEKV